jgi:hypothetical protein
LRGWLDLLTDVVREAERTLGSLGPFPALEMATLIGQAFLGGESMVLLGFDRSQVPVRSALRRFALLIRALEEGATSGSAGDDGDREAPTSEEAGR